MGPSQWVLDVTDSDARIDVLCVALAGLLVAIAAISVFRRDFQFERFAAIYIISDRSECTTHVHSSHATSRVAFRVARTRWGEDADYKRF